VQLPQCLNILRYFWCFIVTCAKVQHEFRMVSIVGEKGGYFCGSGLGVVVAEFCNWQEFLPVVLLIVAVYPEIVLKSGICSFCLSVHLWVESCAKVP